MSGSGEDDAEERLKRTAPCHALMGRSVVRADPGSGEAELHFEGSHDFTNGMGNIQGGFLAAMLDSTMGCALATVLEEGESPPTLELKISFIRAGRPGGLSGHGRVVQRTRSVAFVEGELRDPGGELVATASATHLIRRTDAGDPR